MRYVEFGKLVPFLTGQGKQVHMKEGPVWLKRWLFCYHLMPASLFLVDRKGAHAPGTPRPAYGFEIGRDLRRLGYSVRLYWGTRCSVWLYRRDWPRPASLEE
jgi:hypothetical protein